MGYEPESELEYELLDVVRDGHVATVTFRRPEKLNALSRKLMREITHVARAFEDDTEARVVIFTGAGEHFSAGADLREAGSGDATPGGKLQLRRRLGDGPAMVRAIYEMPQITIAAVNGVALGGGACIATACDFRIGARDSFCGYPEVNLGMNLQWVALPLCVHLVGPARAKRMIGLGRKENSETLLRWGFYDEVVERSELLERAMSMARDYAAQPPMAVQMIKQSVNAVVSALDASVMHMDRDQWMLTATSQDFQEGVRAFLEKRKPEFTGE